MTRAEATVSGSNSERFTGEKVSGSPATSAPEARVLAGTCGSAGEPLTVASRSRGPSTDATGRPRVGNNTRHAALCRDRVQPRSNTSIAALHEPAERVARELV